jgi:hypothetical protein
MTQPPEYGQVAFSEDAAASARQGLHPPSDPGLPLPRAEADPGEAERDRLIEEAAGRFPEYSHLDQQQEAIDADARANWGSSYPEYEGPGYTEPPVNWEGWHTDHSDFDREHYWDDFEWEARTEVFSPSAGPAPGPPPEYGQVTGWLRAVSADAGFLSSLESGYYDSKYPEETLERYVVDRWKFLADRARRALDGVDLEGKSLDEVAWAYHDKQIAAHAIAQRSLQQRIRALDAGDFEPDYAWAAREAALRGTSLEQEIEEDRQRELSHAEEELARLFAGNVSEQEAEAWWASAAGRAAAQDAMTTGPVSLGHAVPGEAATASTPAAVKPARVLVPTASQVGYANVMADAARGHSRRMSAAADQACQAARAAGWADRNANETARLAVHAADVAVRHAAAANHRKWDIKYREPRRNAMLAWHGQHPVGGQPAVPTPADGSSLAMPAEKAELGRLFRAAADLMEQAGIPGLDVSCSPQRGEITIGVPEDCGDIRSRIAKVDHLASICGGESAPVPRFGEGCDWISAAGQFAGCSVQIYTPSRPQPGKPPRAEPELVAARQAFSAVAARVDFPLPPVTADPVAHDGVGQTAQRPGPPLNRAVRAARASLAKTARRTGSL